MNIRSLLNGGVAEVDDETAKAMIASGHWSADEAAPVVRKARAPRAKVAPADNAE